MANNKIISEVKKFVKSEFAKPTALYKSSFESHFVIVVKYALELAEKEKADKEVVEISAWLHDIGSIMGDYKNHHETSARIAEELLTKLNYSKDKIEKVKAYILSHRGSIPMHKESKEAQILADADVMAHFDSIKDLLKIVFKGNKKETLGKLERGYAKLSENGKLLMKDKLELARKQLA